MLLKCVETVNPYCQRGGSCGIPEVEDTTTEKVLHLENTILGLHIKEFENRVSLQVTHTGSFLLTVLKISTNILNRAWK